MSEKATQHSGSGGLETKVESRAGAAITVTRIEMPTSIKAAISDRIAAAKASNG